MGDGRTLAMSCMESMIWECQWCGHPCIVPATNPVAYVCDGCGREAGGVFDPAPLERDLTEEEEAKLVEVRVTWSGVAPDTRTLLALRSLDPMLRDEPLAVLVAGLRQKGYHSLGVHPRIDAQRVADEARLRGLQVGVKELN